MRPILCVLLVACAAPRWNHDIVIEADLRGAPPWAGPAIAHVADTYAHILNPMGMNLRLAAPGERGQVRIAWRTPEAGREGNLGYTETFWEVDGDLTAATITMRHDWWAPR